jgi:hypothetical protein
MTIDYPDVERTLADAFGDMRPVAVAYLEKLPARSATLTVGLSPAPVRSLLGWPLQSPLADRTECNDDCALHLSFDHSMKALPSSA